MSPQVVRTRAELAAALDARPLQRVLVPTMGALHAGHEALIRRARELAGPEGTVVVSIFVNPLQFDQEADLAAYPVTLAADLDVVQASGGDVVWAPAVEDMYPPGELIEPIEPGPAGAILEGASRPGHFAGMLTVVYRLLLAVDADQAVFGEKDYQQLVLVTELVRKLEIPTEILAVPIVRDPDGLALSSRNARLSPEDRTRALALSRAMAAGAAGGGRAEDVVDRARLELAGVDVDYLVCLAPDLGPPPEAGEARLLVAAVVGGVRLIDNVRVRLTGAE